MSNVVIGIDLGTTNSCVGAVVNGQEKVIPNSRGKNTTPSIVAFTSEHPLVGDLAKKMLSSNPTNTIFNAKRLIGRKFDEESVTADIQHWPFKVVSDNNKPKIQVEFEGQTRTFYPEQISSMVLAEMKSAAEEYLGEEVTRAIVTVPAYFNDSQRQATKDAGTIAGLDVIRVINEPTAAAIAYGLDKKDYEKTNVLIFDLGGGTFDVSILTIDKDQIEVKATAGDSHLGGEDFDNRFMEYCVQLYKEEKSQWTKEDLMKLKSACEDTKQALSSTDRYYLDFGSGKMIERETFEGICSDLFEKTFESVEKALSDAKMQKNQIKEVVLVGGSTRIPKIQELLKEFFGMAVLNKRLNADEAVAIGAALQGAVLSGNSGEKSKLLLDVAPISLGIDTVTGQMSVLIARNTPIPCERTKEHCTAHDNQTAVDIEVYEGEFAVAKENNLLGKFTLSGIPPAPRGEEKFKVTFNLDANGILNVRATALGPEGELTNAITIENDKGRLTGHQIEEMVRDAQAKADAKKAKAEARQARGELNRFIKRLKSGLKEKKGDMDEEEVGLIGSEIEAAHVWLMDGVERGADDFTQKHAHLKKACLSLVARLSAPKRKADVLLD